MNKRSNFYTLMFIPEDNGKTVTLRIHRLILRTILVFLLIFLAGLFLLLFKSGEIAAKLQLLYLVNIENEKLTKENEQLRMLKEKIDTINVLASYIDNLVVPSKLSEKFKIRSTTTNSSINIEAYKSQFAKNSSIENSPQSSNINDRITAIPNIFPVNGWITRQYSILPDLSSNIHQAIDFAATTGSPIKATAPVIVEDVQNDKYFGLIVMIKHDFGFVTKYGHCSQILVSKKEKVNRGQTIALVGNTGRSTAPHLHYEILKDGKNVDPNEYLLVHQK